VTLLWVSSVVLIVVGDAARWAKRLMKWEMARWCVGSGGSTARP